jgi:hypothetical protein
MSILNRDGSGRVQALMGRRAALDAALRAEKEKCKAIALREQERLASIVGRALLASAKQTPEFAAMLRGVLRNTPLSESDHRFVESKGWL